MFSWRPYGSRAHIQNVNILDWVRISDESRSLRQGVLKTKYEFWGSRIARKRLGRNSSVRSLPACFCHAKVRGTVGQIYKRDVEGAVPYIYCLFAHADSRGYSPACGNVAKRQKGCATLRGGPSPTIFREDNILPYTCGQSGTPVPTKNLLFLTFCKWMLSHHSPIQKTFRFGERFCFSFHPSTEAHKCYSIADEWGVFEQSGECLRVDFDIFKG